MSLKASPWNNEGLQNQHFPLSCPWILRLNSQNNKVRVTLLQRVVSEDRCRAARSQH